MIRHIVFFKNDDKAKIKELEQKLQELRTKIDFLVDMEVGVDFLGSPRSFDLSLCITLKNKEDLKAYDLHPHHVPIVEWVRANGFESKSVDYEV